MSAAQSPRRFNLSRHAMAALLALGAMQVQAQTLQELYDTARGYDATYLAARALAESAQYKADQAHALRRPNVGAAVTYGRTTSETPLSDTTNRGPNATLNARQTLFNAANDASIAQADLGVDNAKADLALAEQDLIVRVAIAYFDVLAAQDALTTAQASTKAISEQLASAKRNFEVGTATITDTREAQARYDLATAQELATENELLTKRIALDQLVGRSGVQPKPLTVPVTLPPVSPADVNSWVSQADSSPLVRKFQIGYELAQLETRKARAGHLPTVDLTGSAGRGRTDGQSKTGAAPTINYSGNNSQSSVALTLNVPLFAGFSVQNRVKETLLLEEQARNTLEANRRSATQNARTAFFGAQSLQARVKALEAAETSSKVALDATQLGYKVGVRVNLDVLNAQTQLYSTRRDLARARYDVLLNDLKLRQAAGTLNPADVSAVNNLLVK